MNDPPRGQSQMVRLSRWQFTVKKSVKMQTLRAISTSTTLDFYTPLLPHSLPLTPVTPPILTLLHALRLKQYCILSVGRKLKVAMKFFFEKPN